MSIKEQPPSMWMEKHRARGRNIKELKTFKKINCENVFLD
jgi:hypothetical protein